MTFPTAPTSLATPTITPPVPTPPARPADPFDHRLALGAAGLLGAFNAAGVLAGADVHVATRLGRLGREADETVLLALALAVRGVRQGSVCVRPATLHRTVLGESEDPAAIAALPWPDPAAWLAACATSPLVTPGADGAAGRPARQVGDLLYLERYWRQEEQVRGELARRSAPRTPEEIDVDGLRAGLARYFPGRSPGPDTDTRAAEPDPADPDGHPDPTDDGVDRQRLAAAVSAVRRVSVLAGGPGTGKTTTVARLLALLAASPPPGRPRPRIALAAPTGKAAARLEEAVREQLATLDAGDRERVGDLRAATVHRLLGTFPGATRPRHDHTDRLPYDVVVVDETSMVSLTMMARLLDALRPDTHLVLVGDPDQLASVEAGAVLGDLTRAGGTAEPALVATLAALGVTGGDEVVNGVVTLRRTYRFGGAIAALARAVQSGDADAALAILRAGRDGVRLLDRAGEYAGLPPEVRADVDATAARVGEAALAGDARGALAALDAHRVLCGHRSGPFGAAWWGAEIERRLAGPNRGLADPWYPGRPVLVTANDYDTGVYNGDTGVVVRTAAGPRVAFARGGAPVLVAPTRLAEVLTVHAMTVHRAQGSQFTGVTVVLPPAESPLLTRELLYTALTRARATVRVIGSQAAVRAAVRRPVDRASGLRLRLGRAP
ncbi:MAG: exodeoxyribonuclease V subunit alpha [Pseudonocardia sp.]